MGQKEILPGLAWPQGLQGHDDETIAKGLVSPHGTLTPQLLARYKTLASMEPGIRRYNVDWNAFEAVPGQSKPFACAPGFVLTPATPEELKTRHYHRFHCYNTMTLNTFDTLSLLDRQLGAQNAAIIYAAPTFAIHPNCTGFKFGNEMIRSGCLPLESAMDDFEDFINLVSERYTAPANQLAHFIVWNEVASQGWLDPSPMAPNRAGPNGSNPLTDAQFDYIVSRYADLVTRVFQVVRRHSDRAMIWTSNDRLWERPEQHAGDILHVGVRPFLDRLWPKLRDNITWALAVHPYDPGNPMDASEFSPDFPYPHRYTFATLDRVLAYMKAQLVTYTGLDPDSKAGRPFTLLYPSEQGWPFPACCADRIRARNVCYAQALSLALPDHIVAVTHNFFQDRPGGTSQGGQDYGLIAGNISSNLTNGAGYPTFDAYVSTSPGVWGRSDTHFCCVHWHQGCNKTQSFGTFDELHVSADNGTVALHGWAWDAGLPGGGGLASVSVAISFDSKQVATAVANVSRPDLVAADAAPDAMHGFVATLPLPTLQSGQILRIDVAILHSPSHNNGSWPLPQSPRCLADGKEVPC
eukprot:m.100038 g.100038  ORF g.100038 m.100038 type:complete len:580 (+) comp15373_c1_seq2:174-1913(+)